MKIGYIGSCFSGKIVESLLLQNKNSALAAALTHIRTDLLVEHWVGKKILFPNRSTARAIIEYLEQKGELNKNKNRISCQSNESLSSFLRRLKEMDCLLIDNNFDLSSKLWRISFDGEEYILSNLQVKKQLIDCENLGLLALDKLKNIYQSFVDFVVKINPKIKIFILHYPVSGFLQMNAETRIRRAALFDEICSQIDGAFIIPSIEISLKDLSEKGPHYFSDRAYEIYAKLVARIITLGSVPSWFKSGMQLDRVGAWLEGDLVDVHNDSPDSNIGVDGAMVRKSNPYESLPDRQYWKLAVGDRYPLGITEIYDKKYSIRSEDRIATFGSCFAQHIGYHLKSNGFNFLDLEPAPSSISPADHKKLGYGIYSARYGNVYTSLQMLQLFQQAFGEISFDEVWEREGRYYDPFRPNIFPGGFSSPDEMLQERQAHLGKVRSIFETSEIIVLTLGLTECWCNQLTGAVYPTAPGVTVGQFDSSAHVFRNLGYMEIRQHVQELLTRLSVVNPKVRLVLTVSPVPLTATYEDKHVLVSTMHSKSILRSVAGDISSNYDSVDYFPSYEIIMSSPLRSMFFKSNLRNVHEGGVSFVMSHFFAQHGLPSKSNRSPDDEEGEDFCDEIFLELSKKIQAR